MKSITIKDKIFYGFLTLTAAATLYVMGVAPLLNNGQHHGNANASNSKTTTAPSHDETNSDGHHNTSSEASSTPAIDLTAQSQVTIEIKDFAYSKQNIKIKKGTTVTWTNQDTVEHNVMKEHESDADAHDAPSKDQVRPDVLASQLLAKGESYSFTFDEVSANPYHCSPHPYMKGSVTVVE
jgi:plastocyanin